MGSNLGDRAGYLRAAVQGLAAHPQVLSVVSSPVYETLAQTARPGETAPAYLNAVLALDTTFSPEALLEVCLALEAQYGRIRQAGQRWASRTLDLDVLAWGTMVLAAPGLTLPHPRLAERRFVLLPWADLAPDFHVPPPYAATVADLLARCPDTDPPPVRMPLPLLDLT